MSAVCTIGIRLFDTCWNFIFNVLLILACACAVCAAQANSNVVFLSLTLLSSQSKMIGD